MKTILHYLAEPAILKVRLFDSRKGVRDENFVNLDEFYEYGFTVVEVIGGKETIILEKKNECISVSKEIDGYMFMPNTVNVQVVPEDTSKLKPNPPNRDRLRFWILRGHKKNIGWTMLDRGYFYLDSMTAA